MSTEQCFRFQLPTPTESSLPPPPSDDPTTKKFYGMIKDFLLDGQAQLRDYDNLDVDQRKIVHEIADLFGLHHHSYGNKTTGRTIRLTKPTRRLTPYHFDAQTKEWKPVGMISYFVTLNVTSIHPKTRSTWMHHTIRCHDTNACYDDKKKKRVWMECKRSR